MLGDVAEKEQYAETVGRWEGAETGVDVAWVEKVVLKGKEEHGSSRARLEVGRYCGSCLLSDVSDVP